MTTNNNNNNGKYIKYVWGEFSWMDLYLKSSAHLSVLNSLTSFSIFIGVTTGSCSHVCCCSNQTVWYDMMYSWAHFENLMTRSWLRTSIAKDFLTLPMNFSFFSFPPVVAFDSNSWHNPKNIQSLPRLVQDGISGFSLPKHPRNIPWLAALPPPPQNQGTHLKDASSYSRFLEFRDNSSGHWWCMPYQCSGLWDLIIHAPNKLGASPLACQPIPPLFLHTELSTMSYRPLSGDASLLLFSK